MAGLGVMHIKAVPSPSVSTIQPPYDDACHSDLSHESLIRFAAMFLIKLQLRSLQLYARKVPYASRVRDDGKLPVLIFKGFFLE